MLMTAQLYERELMEKFYHIFYDKKYMYYTGETGLSLPKLPKNNIDSHNFVCIDRNNKVIGYLAYRIDMLCMCIRDISIINFTDKNSILFIKDIFEQIIRLFKYHNINKIEFFAFADNPAYPNYKKFVEKLGGQVCGIYHQTAVLADGKFHDGVFLEILMNIQIQKYFNKV